MDKIVKKQKIETKINYYTFIMNYLGGVYISQIHANDELNAMRVWLKNLNTLDIKGLLEEEKQSLIKDDFLNERPIPIESLKKCLVFWLTNRS